MEPTSNSPRANVIHVDDVWLVRVENADGRVQEYRCASESQAKQLMLVLVPPPKN